MSDAAGADPYLGRTLDDRYRIDRLLGRGGMGAVYEGRDTRLDRRVAIKVMLGDRNADAIARFRREALIASKLEHEHVVRIFDVGTDDSEHHYLVMEYLEGRDLRRALADDGPFSPERATAIGKQLLHGLHAIHEAGIVHRDLKPANVLLTRRDGDRDHAKIMDFGISKIASADDGITRTGQVVGTPQYMSPEQLAGRELDRRSDLYSAALTLYELVAGAPPFTGNTAELTAMHLRDQPRPLDEIVPDVPLAYVRAIERSLEKRPEHRHASALEFAAAIDGTGLDGTALAPAGSRHTTGVHSDTRDAATVVDRPASRNASPKRGARRWLPYGAAATLALGVPAIVYAVLVKPEVPRAGAPIDAAVADMPTLADAALPPPDAMLVDAAVDAPIDAGRKPAPRHPTVAATGKHCRCVSESLKPLCARVAGTRCRCGITPNAPLCPTEPKVRCSTPFAMSIEVAGQRCEGYVHARGMLQKGVYFCHHCPDEPIREFRGENGDRCKGFDYYTGGPINGVLAACE